MTHSTQGTSGLDLPDLRVVYCHSANLVKACPGPSPKDRIGRPARVSTLSMDAHRVLAGSSGRAG